MAKCRFDKGAKDLISDWLRGWPLFLPALGWALYELFKRRQTPFQEPCRYFVKAYTTEPYSRLSTRFYNNSGFTEARFGYYDDGSRIYTQNADSIVSSELGYVTRDGVVVYSTEPDDPSFIEDVESLRFLPYVSGIPIEWATPAPPVYKSVFKRRFILSNLCKIALLFLYRLYTVFLCTLD